MSWRRPKLWIGLLLLLGTTATYLPAVRHDFVPWDDPEYVAQNPRIADGLTPHGIVRTFTQPYYCNWTPLTTLSYALDHRLYGGSAGGYLLTNLLLHAIASWLLFVALMRLTRATGPSAVVAALFAVHPLHVEAVAWVSQRKDVLSAVFFMATLWSYARYVERPSTKRYGAVVLFLGLGLLSKPMLVTVPFVLLLLDFWPLGRVPWSSPRAMGRAGARLLAEKLPLLALAAASSWIAYRAQQSSGSMATFSALPLAFRLGNVPAAYLFYLEKTFWPSRLAFFYPLVLGPRSFSDLALPIGVLLALTAGALAPLRRAPYLAVGWLWYLGMLVPVIGLVQVGEQAYADRYSYLPQIGLTIALVWGVRDGARRVGLEERRLVQLAIAVLLLLGLTTARQIAVWRDGVALGAHALRVLPPSATAHIVLASALFSEERYDEARNHANAALGLNPDSGPAHYVLGNILRKEGKKEEAVEQYRLALRLDPRLDVARVTLGEFLESLGRHTEALSLLSQTIASNTEMGQPEAEVEMGLALVAQGRLPEAIQEFEAALRMAPDLAQAHANLGAVLTQTGQLGPGEAHLRRALASLPDKPEVHGVLADNLQRQGRAAEAVAEWRETLRLDPTALAAMNNLAWLLATAEDPAARSPGEAVALAEKAAEATGRGNASVLDTLAAAYAAAGRREDAAATARLGIEVAQRSGEATLAREMGERLARYQGGGTASPP